MINKNKVGITKLFMDDFIFFVVGMEEFMDDCNGIPSMIN